MLVSENSDWRDNNEQAQERHVDIGQEIDIAIQVDCG